jgi:hypothetical protein
VTSIDEEREQLIYHALYAGRKIEAIKIHREVTGAGLKESKDFIDALEAQLRVESPQRFSAPPKRGCAAMTVLAAAGAVGVIISL